jgi:hypothetical protein
MADASNQEKRTANDNLYRLTLASATNRDFDPSDFEKLMDQKLSESKRSDIPASDVLICHAY